MGCPALPFIDQGGSRGYKQEKEEKTKGREGPLKVSGLSFPLEPTLLSWQTMPEIACLADPDRAGLWFRFSKWSRPILPRRMVRCVRAPSHDSAGSRLGNDYMPVTVDDVSSSLECSGCCMLVSGSTPEG